MTEEELVRRDKANIYPKHWVKTSLSRQEKSSTVIGSSSECGNVTVIGSFSSHILLSVRSLSSKGQLVPYREW